MSEPGPDGRSLIEAGRKAFQPTTADRERVLQALRGRIPVEHGNLGGPASPAAVPAAKGVVWFGASAAAVGLAVVAAVFLPRSASDEKQAPVVSVASRGAPAPSAEVTPRSTALSQETAVEAPAAVSPSPAATAAAARIPSAPRASDRLSEEVAILSRAESERHAGRFSSALTLLEEHRRKFPRGSLTQERMAARIRVLCALGRVSEAEAALATLKRTSPSSVHLPPRAACATK